MSEGEAKEVKIIYQVCPLIHCWKNPAHYFWWEMNQVCYSWRNLALMWFNLLVLQMSTLESIRGKWFVQGCYVMNQCQSLLTRVLALCSTILGLFSGTTWEKINFPSIWQPFKYVVTVLGAPESSSGKADFHWLNVSIMANFPDSSSCSIFSRSASYCQFPSQALVSRNEYITPGYISKRLN